MRCHKCGFISFDHLSECKKCVEDLTAVRQQLGLLPVKPSAPFSLGIPARKIQEPPAMPPPLKAPMESVDALGAGAGGLQEGVSLKEPVVSGTVPSSEAQVGSYVPAGHLEAGPSPAKSQEISTMKLSADDPKLFLQDPQAATDATNSVSKKEEVPSHPPAGLNAADLQDDGVIELSDEDLDGLLLELEGLQDTAGDKERVLEDGLTGHSYPLGQPEKKRENP
jgi:hypothetical protein